MFGRELVFDVLGTGLHQDECIVMLLDKSFQSEIALSPPNPCVEKVVLLFQFLFPFIFASILVR